MKAASMLATAARPVSANTKDPELIRDRRDQLIRAALEVFQEKGFHATTVRDIGRAAGLTQGTIYNYVRSKEDILFLVCDRVIAEYISSMEQAVAATGDCVLAPCECPSGSNSENTDPLPTSEVTSRRRLSSRTRRCTMLRPSP